MKKDENMIIVPKKCKECKKTVFVTLGDKEPESCKEHN